MRPWRCIGLTLCILLISVESAKLPPQLPAVDLQRDRLSPAYRARLVKSAHAFSQWCARRGTSIAGLSSQVERMNTYLIEYVQLLFTSGQALWKGTHTVLAVQTLHRSLKGKLRPAWDSIQSWKLMRPVRSRIPMPEPILEALCKFSLLAALSLDTKNSLVWWNFAVMLRVGFYGLLRPKEIYRVTRNLTRVPGLRSFLSVKVAVLTIVDPKNRAHMGRLQVRMIKDETTVDWLAWMVRYLPPDSNLWLFSPYRFRKCLT
jgi:hypothetical protein